MKTVIVPGGCELIVHTREALAKFKVFGMNGSTIRFMEQCPAIATDDDPEVDCHTCKHKKKFRWQTPCRVCKIEYVDTTFQEYEPEEE